MKKFMKICRKEQMELKAWLEKVLKGKYKNVVNGDGFLYAKGNIPVLLTAHMDTVHKDRCTEITISKGNGRTVLSSPQGIGGDDRCGIWIIYKILTKSKLKPYVLFCEDEEIGGVGSGKFVKTKYVDELSEVKYLIELDRANKDDAVYYDCGNEEFKDYIEHMVGYKENWGSFSDIGHLSPACDKASVNLSCGYYNAHTLQEYVVFEEMERTFKVVQFLLDNIEDSEFYDYQEMEWFSKETTSTYGEWWSKPSYSNEFDVTGYEIVFEDENGKEDCYFTEALSYDEAIGRFLIDHDNLTFKNVLDYYEYAV